MRRTEELAGFVVAHGRWAQLAGSPANANVHHAEGGDCVECAAGSDIAHAQDCAVSAESLLSRA
jgi:hypothetical protein